MKKSNHYINKETADRFATAVFIILQTILYSVFMWQDFSNGSDTTNLKYATICLCLVFTVYKLPFSSIDGLLVFLALLFTVASDTFTLLINDYFTLGVSLFIPAQLIYGLRMRVWAEKPLYKSIIARFSVIVAVVLGATVAQIADGLTLVTAIYFSMLLYNAIESVFFAKTFKRILFCIGLWLFICCDVCVGLYNLTDVLGVAVNKEVFNFASIMMWGFYLPSQVLIVTSIRKEKLAPLRFK
ncbi:MAG: hypothetical protein IJW64_06375 [Clostridia bacterium]|nr:hypothetical protein [Clostridia bacterium]